MRSPSSVLLALLLALSLGCGPPPAPSPSVDAGPGPFTWTELPEERLNVICRPIIGATLQSVDPAATEHWRASAANVLLRSSDEGRTWTRAPLDPGLSVLAVGPVMLAFANSEPLALGQGRWSVSADRGTTWQPLAFSPTTDATLPAGSLTGTAGTARIAWTPTGRLLVSLEGGPWRSEPDAFLDADGDDWHRSLDEREWLAQHGERRLYASRDLGRTWVNKPWRELREVRLSGEQGLWAATFEGFLTVSTDDGETWQDPPLLSGAFAVGPAAGEVWVQSKPTAPEVPRLMHSRDWGRTFAPVRLSLGAAGELTNAMPRGRAVALPGGRTVLDLQVFELDPLTPGRMTCITTDGAGALEQPAPQKSDAPGTATLWARGRPGQALGSKQQGVPLAEPGRAYWAGERTFSDAVSITGVTRTMTGSVALLLQPVAVVDRSAGPPMFVRELEPAGLTATVITKFDNLLELDGSGEQKFLEAHTLQALPDGRFLADTPEGQLPVGGSPAMWAPWPADGRWGLDGTGVAQVRRETVGATQYFRRSRTLAEAELFCDVATLPTERCVSYPGHVADFGHRNGRVYVLDDWRGEVLEAALANLDGQWRVVLTGLAKPSSLFIPLDDDPGLYVVDTHLYRVVPNPGVTARRP